jgi:hypothetical protein
MCFPNLFREELLCPRPTEVDLMFADPDAPETVMVAFADEP